MRALPAGMVGAALAVALLAACTPGGPTAPEDTARSTPTGGTVATPGVTQLDAVMDRAAHTATLLPDGQVLVVGGCVVDGCSDATASTELFDPSTGAFAAGPELESPRDGHSATRLANGDVLLVGGYASEGQRPLATAELYLAATGELLPAGEMAIGRGAHVATALGDGRVLIAGGWTGPHTFTRTAEVWDAATREFTPVAPLISPRGGATGTLLPDGDVLVVGGEDQPGRGLATSEIYRPSTDTWRTGPELAEPRFKHAAVALPTGDVLVVGGTPDDERLVAAVERFDGAAFQAVGSLTEGRYKLTDAVVVLPDGQVLVAGGGETTETYDPAGQTSRTLTVTPRSARASFATVTLLGDGGVLVIGATTTRSTSAGRRTCSTGRCSPDYATTRGARPARD